VPEVRSNGIVTYRDGFVYGTRREALSTRLRQWHELNPQAAAELFGDTRDRKSGPAFSTTFDASLIEEVTYRPLDRRVLYNRREFIDFPRTDLQNAWGVSNIALMCMSAGTGKGPAVWCHGLKPDQHAFRGSFGGWIFPLRNHVPGSAGHYLAAGLLPGLTEAYGETVTPEEVFDAVLALLSASSYTTRFAHDLEDAFPHVPLPADPELFRRSAAIGNRIRELETHAAQPADRFRTAQLAGNHNGQPTRVPPPRQAFTPDGATGTISLTANGSFLIRGVSLRVWQFAVSDYQVIHSWISFRRGEPIDATFQRAVLDLVWRVEELIHLFDEADALLAESLANTLTRTDVGVAAVAATEEVEED
jgi:hypothetical protein